MATKEELQKMLYDFQAIRGAYKNGADRYKTGSNEVKRNSGKSDRDSALYQAKYFISKNPILQDVEDEINQGLSDQFSLSAGFELADMDKYIDAIEQKIKGLEE